MDLALSGKVALVTGSSRGIGKAIAMELAREGAVTVICGRDEARTHLAYHEVRSVSVNYCHYFCLDAMKAHEIKNMFRSLLWRQLNKIDVLVNNLGGPLSFGKFEDLADDDWLDNWIFNLMSVVRFTREALPWLKKSASGRIINISAVPAKQPGEFNPHYAVSKAAVENLTKSMANEFARYNILVNAIRPNTLEGGLWEENVKDRANRDNISIEEAAEKIKASTFRKSPLQRMGEPEDVANLVAFLASDKAKHITGTVINVDGGTVRSAA